MADKRPSVESDHEDASPKKRQRAKPKLTPALYKATLIEKADSASIRVTSSTSDVADAILQRIKKCLDRAKNGPQDEPETKAAVYLASKLMKLHNLEKADVLAHETPEEQRKYAGSSAVSIQRVDGDCSKRVLKNTYVGDLCLAMQSFFDCESYTTAPRVLQPSKLYRSSAAGALVVTFYGIAQSTLMAANAFEMVYNQAVEWARSQKGQSSKNSYCIGLAAELSRRAEKEKEEEEARAKKADEHVLADRIRKENEEAQAKLDRLHELKVVNDDAGASQSQSAASDSPDHANDGMIEDTLSHVDAVDPVISDSGSKSRQPHVEEIEDEATQHIGPSSQSCWAMLTAVMTRTGAKPGVMLSIMETGTASVTMSLWPQTETSWMPTSFARKMIRFGRMNWRWTSMHRSTSSLQRCPHEIRHPSRHHQCSHNHRRHCFRQICHCL